MQGLGPRTGFCGVQSSLTSSFMKQAAEDAELGRHLQIADGL